MNFYIKYMLAVLSDSYRLCLSPFARFLTLMFPKLVKFIIDKNCLKQCMITLIFSTSHCFLIE